MDEQLFSDLFVDVVEERGLERFGDQSQLARAIWGKKSSPSMWRNIRNGTRRDGKRAIKISDMLLMARALQEDLSILVARVEQKHKLGIPPKPREKKTVGVDMRGAISNNTDTITQ